MEEIIFASGSVPVAVAARVYGKDASWIRAGIVSGWLPIGKATRNGKLVTNLEEMNSKYGRIDMSSIKAFECLTGHISGLCTLSGKLTCFGSLSGKLSAVIDFNAYSGEYEVVPNAFNTQVLPTANKVLKKDIVVQKVPYFETSNNYDGVTVYIAEEVNQNA